MCGIAGIVGEVSEANRAALRRMSAAMVHRGPDADGTWESPPDAAGQGVMLAHRRLAILDLSPAGVQPMIDPATGQALVYNGEIYNYRELRAELERDGQRFGSSGDTAVLLRALTTRGRGVLGGLRGMFAFALWDPARRELLLARDPLGIKPLYLARAPAPGGGWSLAFASELRALLASGFFPSARLDPRAVASMVWNGFVVGPSTAVQGIELLDPGRALVVDARGAERASEEFWSIPGTSPSPPLSEEELARALEEDVRLHLASDVPLAVFLSGGVDSSAVANLAQRAAATPIHTFTLAFEEQELNEGPIARRIAQALGTQHHEVLLTESHFVANLEKALDSLDQPTFDGLNAYYLSRAIGEAGFTVAVAGTGGDELFGGYATFRDLPLLHRALRATAWVPGALRTGAARLATAPARRPSAGFPPQTRWAKLPDMVERGDDLVGLYQLAYALFVPATQRELVGASVADALRDGLTAPMRDRLVRETAGRAPLSALSAMEQRIFLGERLLRDNDVASMASSLEQRVPFVDRVLFEAVDRLPDQARYQPVGRKAALRRAGLRGLDPAIFDRPKSGFVLPFDRWIRQGLRGAVDEALRDPQAVRQAGLDPGTVQRLWRGFTEGGGRGMYWSRAWAVYVLVRWCQRNGVRA